MNQKWITTKARMMTPLPIDGYSKAAPATRPLKHRRLFIEAQCELDAARWVEIALTEEFFNRLLELNDILSSAKLTKVECSVQALWGVNEGWCIEPDSTMGMHSEFAYFEATAYPTGMRPPRLALRKKVQALLFYGSVSDFIANNRHSPCEPLFDEIMVNPEDFGLDRSLYRESTIHAMQEDQRNDFISSVNIHLLKSGSPTLRLRGPC